MAEDLPTRVDGVRPFASGGMVVRRAADEFVPTTGFVTSWAVTKAATIW